MLTFVKNKTDFAKYSGYRVTSPFPPSPGRRRLQRCCLRCLYRFKSGTRGTSPPV
jgi:hypothetical protein